uniref:Uncharacterized protein n=1 Tax=Ornithodoros turicata TaxID=34597 RepID=A0A2R5L7V5_9ACAR
MECCEDPENPGSFYVRLIRQDLLIELVKCKNSGLVVCLVDTEFLVYRVKDFGVTDTTIEGDMVRDIGAMLKGNGAVDGVLRNRAKVSVHIFTNVNFYECAGHVADELGIRVFCHRFHSQ